MLFRSKEIRDLLFEVCPTGRVHRANLGDLRSIIPNSRSILCHIRVFAIRDLVSGLSGRNQWPPELLIIQHVPSMVRASTAGPSKPEYSSLSDTTK